MEFAAPVIAAEVETEMAAAVAEASASPWPAVADLTRDVYSPVEGASR